MGKNYKQIVGNNIIFQRNKMNISQLSLSQKTRISRSHLNKIEKGIVNANLSTIQKISLSLNISLSSLFVD